MRFSLPFLALATLVGVALAFPAAAQDAGSSSKKRKPRDPNEQVCKNEEVLGSRLAVRRVCMSRSEWAQRQFEDRQRTEQTQLQRHALGN